MPSSKKLETIRGLLAKAESTTYPEEAEALSAKAMELMVQYGIDEAMLASTEKRQEQITAVTVKIRNPYSKNKMSLLNAIAVSQSCRSIAHPDPSGRSYSSATVVGYPSDIERVELLFTSLLLQATRQVMNVHSPYGRGTTKYRSDWFLGFTIAVNQRLHAIVKHATSQAEAKTPGTEIVLMSRTDLVDRQFNELFGASMRVINRPRWADAHAYDRGKTAGKNADLNQTRFTGSRHQVAASGQ